jgi:hypothetical protein
MNDNTTQPSVVVAIVNKFWQHRISCILLEQGSVIDLKPNINFLPKPEYTGKPKYVTSAGASQIVNNICNA